MCPSTLSARAEALASSASHVAPSGITTPQRYDEGFHQLHMAWILAADTNGNARPRIHWVVE